MVTYQVLSGDGGLIVKSFNTSAQQVDLSQQLHMLENPKQNHRITGHRSPPPLCFYELSSQVMSITVEHVVIHIPVGMNC